MANNDYRYVEGRGYVANIDGEEVVYDRDELPELLERIRKSKENKNKFAHIQTEDIMSKPDDKLSLKEFIAKHIHNHPELAYIFDKK